MNPPDIKGFIETSFVDWPDHVVSVVFLPRCNFRCPYCHNYHLVLDPGQFETIPLEDVLSRLEHLRGWVDGVCVTGGEPTLHPGIGQLLQAFRGRGWAVKLDTNGSFPDTLEQLLRAGLVNAVAMDVKAPLEPVPYRRNAGHGADPAAVSRAVDMLAASSVPVEIRTTVHPHLLTKAEVLRLAQDLGRRFRRTSDPSSVRLTIQRCRVDDPLDPQLLAHATLDPAEFELWAREAQQAFEEARTRSGAIREARQS